MWKYALCEKNNWYPALFNSITLLLWLLNICQKVWARKVSHCDNVESHNSSYRSWPARWWTTLQTPGSRSTTGSFSTSTQQLPPSWPEIHLIPCRFSPSFLIWPPKPPLIHNSFNPNPCHFVSLICFLFSRMATFLTFQWSLATLKMKESML